MTNDTDRLNPGHRGDGKPNVDSPDPDSLEEKPVPEEDESEGMFSDADPIDGPAPLP